jgi:crooked neck
LFADIRLSTDWEMVFADDERESNPTSFKFLQMAHAWATARKSDGASAPSASAASLSLNQDRPGHGSEVASSPDE